MAPRVVNETLSLGWPHRIWELYWAHVCQGLVSVHIPVQGTVVLAPILDRKVHQVIIVLLERPLIQNQEASRKSKYRRRGFPSRWSQFGSVDCELCQRKEPAGMANHGFRGDIKRHCWITAFFRHENQPGLDVSSFAPFSGFKSSANVRRNATAQLVQKVTTRRCKLSDTAVIHKERVILKSFLDRLEARFLEFSDFRLCPVFHDAKIGASRPIPVLPRIQSCASSVAPD